MPRAVNPVDIPGVNGAPPPWVLFVAGKPTVSYPEGLLSQARSLTSIAKACCLVDERYREAWRDLSRRFWQSNIFSNASGNQIIHGVKNVLATLADRDPSAGAILIPINHCAVDESTWLASTQGAVRLGIENPDTVYILHDSPDNDPRVALNRPEICTSSVMVGSVRALLDLCRGNRATNIVDLVIDELVGRVDQRPPTRRQGDAPLDVVHIRLVEEYARLQRAGSSPRRASPVDVSV